MKNMTITRFEAHLRPIALVAWALYSERHTSDDAMRDWRRAVAVARKRFRLYSVAHGGGRNPYLFTTEDGSAKLAHNADFTDLYEEIVHYGAPASTSGVLNMCPASTRGCRSVCLHTSGQLGMPAQQRATIIRTRFMAEDPFSFLVVWLFEVDRHDTRVNNLGKVLVVRGNGTTDQAWERVWPQAYFDTFFSQDYTKRKDRKAVDGYYVVESTTERYMPPADRNTVVCVAVRKGQPLPETFEGRPVIDGDVHDLRFLDPQGGYAVLVRAKGKARRDTSGFTRQVQQEVAV